MPSPSFSGARLDTHEEYVDDWRGTWDEEQFVHFVAERDGAVVVSTSFSTDGRTTCACRRTRSTWPPRRRCPRRAASGAGRALTEHVLHWAHEHGYPTMITDWRMTNLLASRFWPKRGFRPTFLRLYRALP